MKVHHVIYLIVFATMVIVGSMLLGLVSLAHANPGSENGHHFFLTPDNNGGEDAHMVVSGVIGAGLNFNYRDEWSWMKKSLVCLAPGAAKETLDWLGGSGFSKRDMWSNFKGCAIGFAASSTLIWAFDTDSKGNARVTAQVAIPLGSK